MLGLLRQVRASAQFLDGALADLEAVLGGTDAKQRWAALKNMAGSSKDSINQSISAGTAYLVQAASGLEAAAKLRDWMGDELTTIQLSWVSGTRAARAIRDDLGQLPKSHDQDQVDAILALVRVGRPQISRVIVATATLTIPERLNQHLAQTSVGRSLSFKTLFENELPGEAERNEVLRQIGDAPAAVNGIVDLATGNIVAVSASQGRRRLSYVLEATVLLLGGILAYLIVGSVKGYLVLDAFSFHVPNPAAAAALSNLVSVLFVFVGGAAFHFVVDLLKAQQGSIGSPKWLVLDDWLLWLHARETKIISSIVSLWVVFGAVLIVDSSSAPDPAVAFFAGYSFDSLADVVIKRFDTFAAPQIKQVAEVVAGQSTASAGTAA